MARILCVDDSKSMREMVQYTLESGGHQPRSAEDGVEALQIAKSDTFDLVITDINMPRMDGITLVSELRMLNDYKFTPILVLTTDSSSEQKQRGKAAGATGWIVKPFDPDQLLRTVAKVVS